MHTRVVADVPGSHGSASPHAPRRVRLRRLRRSAPGRSRPVSRPSAEAPRSTSTAAGITREPGARGAPLGPGDGNADDPRAREEAHMLRDVLDGGTRPWRPSSAPSRRRGPRESALGLAPPIALAAGFTMAKRAVALRWGGLRRAAAAGGPRRRRAGGARAGRAPPRSFGADVACGGPVDAACCAPAIASLPAGDCPRRPVSRVLVVARSPWRDTFSRGEETALRRWPRTRGRRWGRSPCRARRGAGRRRGRPVSAEGMDAYDARRGRSGGANLAGWVSGVYFACRPSHHGAWCFCSSDASTSTAAASRSSASSSRVAVVARQGRHRR